MDGKVQGRKGTHRYLVFGLIVLMIPVLMAITACEKQSGDAVQKVVEDASAAYEQGDYATAYRLIKPMAEQGYAKAQYNLGVMYHNGEGVPQDYNETVKWYRKAAEQGLAVAQYNLGVMYNKGEGVPQDHNEAMTWFRKAAGQGYARAQHNLGSMYHKGEGVPKDYNEAVNWYRLAAEQGLADAQYLLGTMYGTGHGVPQDNVLAYMWLTVAASRFSASEGEKRGRTILTGEIIASRMTPEQIAEAQRLANEWNPKKETK
jgi:TPR repeat protein